MIIDMDEYKMKQTSKRLGGISKSTREGALLIADVIHSLAYKARRIGSQLEVNQRNLDKLNER